MKRILYSTLLLSVFILLYITTTSSSGGITGKAAIGCGGGGCHTSSNNTSITLTGIPASGFVLGTSYTCTLTVNNATKAKAGFDLTCSTGTLTAGTGMNLNGTMELYHNTPKNILSGTVSWTFTWTAPASGTTVNFNVAANAVNGNGNAVGDEFWTDNFSYNVSAPVTAAPDVSNVNVSNITTTGATVTANVNANNDNTTAIIEYGLTATYGSSVAMSPALITGNTATPCTGNISGLTPGTLYHYRVKATNTKGITSSPDGTFTTLVPTAITDFEKTNYIIYPNPVLDFLYIKYRNAEIKDIKLYSVLGENIPIQIQKDNEKYTISISTIAKGNYFIVFADAQGKLYTQSIVK